MTTRISVISIVAVVVLAAATGLVIFIPIPEQVINTQQVTPFTVRFRTNDNAIILPVANTLLTCPDSDSNCAAARAGSGSVVDDNDFIMRYVDIDADATTFDSS